MWYRVVSCAEIRGGSGKLSFSPAMQFLPWLNLRETATGTFHTASDIPFSELIAIRMVIIVLVLVG